jgi:hypothetical protein
VYATFARQVRQHAADRARLLAGSLAGRTEGVVSSLGLLYTTLANMRGAAVPVEPAHGPELADEVLSALHRVSGDIAATPPSPR